MSINERNDNSVDHDVAKAPSALDLFPIEKDNPIDSQFEGSIGRTMFDAAGSQDGTVTIVVPRTKLDEVASQSLVKIVSAGDGRIYVAAVVKGPFAEPDGLRADAPVLVSSAAHEAVFMPSFHGRTQVEILGESTDDGLLPPRRRPRPNSPVFLLPSNEAATILGSQGEIRLGLVEGLEDVEVRLPTDKTVLPRHIGILGTTGGGKSTTVSVVISQLQAAGVASVLIDTEGEYTGINEPTTDKKMLQAMARRNLHKAGVPDTHVMHLAGRDTANPSHPSSSQFSLSFSELSPFTASEILDLNDAQQERFMAAYDATKVALDQFKIFPVTNEDRERILYLDELDEGYPGMTLSHIYDVVRIRCAELFGEEDPYLETSEFRGKASEMKQIFSQINAPSHKLSWRALQGRIGRIKRLGIFDSRKVGAPEYDKLLAPGRVTIVDLSDTDSPVVNNLVIAQLLRGIQREQERRYTNAVKAGTQPTPVSVIIEEAHEFLSAERIKQMPTLFGQVARIARRGRKRWLGLVFVTQLPQHLPDEVLGLVNSWVLHKIADAGVVTRLRRSIGGIDESLWHRLPNLAAGQAVVASVGLRRAILTSIDPAPCKLLMID
ncbi:MAG: ATP-binding protein [Dehalococcoidia bacterium]